MDLEQRIQNLEQEMEILKNQIQVTLLDIQEHVLTNRYPSLRAEEAPSRPQTAHNGAAPQVPTANPMMAPIQAVRTVGSAEILDDSQDGNSAPVSVRKVAFEPPAPTEPQVPVRAPAPKRTPPPQQQADWDELSALETWTQKKLRKLGPERTRELIKIYADRGRFSSAVKDTLLGFVSVYGGIPRKRQRREPTRQATQGKRQQTQSKRQSAQKKRRSSQNNHKNGQSRREQSMQAVDQPRRRKRRATATQEAVRSRQRANSKPALNEDADKNHNVVLRLIAGVQNAGAGVNWRKKNG